LACLLAGYSIQVSVSGDEGGFRDGEIRLPSISFLAAQSKALRKQLRRSDVDPVNSLAADLYRFRILQACIELKLFPEDPFVLRNHSENERSCVGELEKLGLAHLISGHRLPGEGAMKPENVSDGDPRTGHRQTEKSIHMDSSIDRVEENKKEIQDYTLNHSFEKIETLEEFKGNWRELDGADQIEEMSDALDELKFNQVIRTEESSEGYLKSDHAGFASEIIGETRGPHLYPEWDYKKRAFRIDHCSVTESKPEKAGDGAEAVLQKNHGTLLKLKHDLDRILNRFSPEPRQVQGDDIDLDAAVEYLVDRSIGHTPSERLYRKRRRNMREVDLLLLLDNSLSTDSYRNGIRVLDAERDGMLLFGEALADAGLPFACYSFHSKTRHNCQVSKLHDFEDSWAVSRNRLMGLEPRGYTRIGPALRHAISILSERSARHRWIVLFTDGHPNDYDRYEGRYGQEDVRHAIQEADGEGIGVHLLSFDRSRDVFGSFTRSALNLRRMPELLMSFYSRIAGN
ncbi:MAG TPA: hypothetical protein DEA96_09625, partial [Leptospiraceae bacterium]|nr:hypothetical protein [Leptospiraceae bacterium]